MVTYGESQNQRTCLILQLFELIIDIPMHNPVKIVSRYALMFLFLLLCNFLRAQYKLSKAVISNDGIKNASSSYSLNLTIGQSLTWKVKINNQERNVGFRHLLKDLNTSISEIDGDKAKVRAPDIYIFPNPIQF